MRTEYFDVGIIGIGAVGAATAYQLAKRGKKRGKKVIGFDQWHPPHNGSSHGGETRITRLAIGEGDFYSQYAIRSHQIWRELEVDTKLDLLTTNGGLIMASQNSNYNLHGNSDFLGETERAAIKYGIDYEMLDTAGIHKKFPQFNPAGDEIGYYEPTAGFLRSDNCITAQLQMARKYGAEIYEGQKVLGVEPSVGGVRIRTLSFPVEIVVDQVIITAGPWISEFLPDNLKSLLKVSRQVLYWFDIRNSFDSFLPDEFPIFIWQKNGGFMYGFPAVNGPEGGLKVASEVINQVNPSEVYKGTHYHEIRDMYRNHIEGWIPDLSSSCRDARVCLYTTTPDSHFIIDRHPELPRVIIASPCSGHGFKHSAAIGETLAEMAIDAKTTLDISPFSLSRFRL